MRIGVFCRDSAGVARLADHARKCFAEMGHEVVSYSQSLDGMASCDFLMFIADPRNAFGGIDQRVVTALSKAECLTGKRCLAVVRKSGFRPGQALRTLMNALEHEGLRIVDSQIAADSRDIERIVRETPLTRR